MECITSCFRVLFEEQFWVGYSELRVGEKYYVARHVFGPEPSGAEIAEFSVSSAYEGLSFSRAFEEQSVQMIQKNPKRLCREVSRSRKAAYGLSKAKDALKVEYAERKMERKAANKRKREQERQRRFDEKQMKRKAKRRGH